MSGTDGTRDSRDKAAQCPTINKDGTPCGGTVLPGATFCIFHDPDRAELRREASRKGGKAKSNTARARKKYVEGGLEPDQLQGLIGSTIVGVLSGRIAPNVANAVAALARTAVVVRDAAEVEERLAALEQRAGVIRRDRIA